MKIDLWKTIIGVGGLSHEEGECHVGFICTWFGCICRIDIILAKIGIDGVNFNLATAIRTIVVLIMAWGMVFLVGAQSGISETSSRSWIFLILSGLATGACWLCYYRALQSTDASKVVPIDKLSVVITLILFLSFCTKSLQQNQPLGQY